MPNEHVFKEQRIAEPHPIVWKAAVCGPSRPGPHVNTDRNVELFCQSPIWFQFRRSRFEAKVLRTELGKCRQLAFLNKGCASRRLSRTRERSPTRQRCHGP